jgi:hypothetical protein
MQETMATEPGRVKRRVRRYQAGTGVAVAVKTDTIVL